MDCRSDRYACTRSSSSGSSSHRHGGGCTGHAATAHPAGYAGPHCTHTANKHTDTHTQLIPLVSLFPASEQKRTTVAVCDARILAHQLQQSTKQLREQSAEHEARLPQRSDRGEMRRNIMLLDVRCSLLGGGGGCVCV